MAKSVKTVTKTVCCFSLTSCTVAKGNFSVEPEMSAVDGTRATCIYDPFLCQQRTFRHLSHVFNSPEFPHPSFPMGANAVHLQEAFQKVKKVSGIIRIVLAWRMTVMMC